MNSTDIVSKVGREPHLWVRNEILIDVLLLLVVWCVGAAVINPIGDFPLLDDWSYERVVKELLNSGDYQPEQWAMMTLVTNVLWGGAFCLPAGLSFTALRISSLAAAALAVIGAYILARDLKRARLVCLVAALTLGFNPVFFSLSYTFMTDAVFVALSIWAAIFLGRSLSTGSNRQLLLGSLTALAAVMSRQYAFCVPLAFALTALLAKPRSLGNALRALAPLLLSVGVFLAFTHWLEATGRVPTKFHTHGDMIEEIFTNPKVPINNAYIAFAYIGLSMFPMSLFSINRIVGSRGYRALLALSLILVAAVLVIRFASGGQILMPMALMDFWLVKTGIGPLTLHDTYVLNIDHVSAWPMSFRIVVTTMSYGGAIFLVFHLITFGLDLAKIRGSLLGLEGNQLAAVFLALCAFIYLPLPVAVVNFVDRYLILPAIFLGIAFASTERQRSGEAYVSVVHVRTCAWVAVSIFAFMAIVGTHDYLAWNRVRWTALSKLLSMQGVDGRDVDGGYEFNGLYYYDPAFRLESHPDRSWWWVRRETYQVTFGPVPGNALMNEYRYRRWFPWETQTVMVLRKE